MTIPRPRKRRHIGFSPRFNEFGPRGKECHEEVIVMKIEEAESLRLMDLENHDQQRCAEMMNIGRTTFQRIYKEARHKLTDSLINGKRIILENEQTPGRGHGPGRNRGGW